MLSVGEDPLQELISASLTALSMKDLANFASTIVQQTLPAPDESVINFQDVSLYVSTGVTVNNIQYPPGLSFSATAEVFHKLAAVQCSVGTQGINLAGSISQFNIGPLAITNSATVAGAIPTSGIISNAGAVTTTGAVLHPGSAPAGIASRSLSGPQFAASISTKAQSLIIDGGVRLLELGAAIHVEVELLPSPNFAFDLSLAFTDLLPFSIKGSMLGAVDPTDIGKLDFALSATLEQNILDYLIAQANLQFIAASQAAQSNIDEQKANLGKIQESFNASIDAAQARLVPLRAAYDAKTASLKSHQAQVSQEMAAGQAAHQVTVDQASKIFQAKLAATQQLLNQNQINAAVAIQNAQLAVNQQTAASNASVVAGEQSLSTAQQNFSSQFGNALATLTGSQDKVQAAQSELEDSGTSPVMLTNLVDVNNATHAVSAAQYDYDHASAFKKVAAVSIRLSRRSEFTDSLQAAKLSVAEVTLRCRPIYLNQQSLLKLICSQRSKPP